MKQSHLKFLKRNGYCATSSGFVDSQPDLQTLWSVCERGRLDDVAMP